jgi:peptidoglycan hydrolase CwlO-like protein
MPSYFTVMTEHGLVYANGLNQLFSLMAKELDIEYDHSLDEAITEFDNKLEELEHDTDKMREEFKELKQKVKERDKS